MPVFDEEFFKQLGLLLSGIGDFFQENIIFGLIAAVVLIALIIFQQLILSLLVGKL